MKIKSNIMSRQKPEVRKAMKFVAVIFALTLAAALALPSTAWGAGFIARIRGDRVDAFFSRTDSSGCIVTDVFVSGSDTLDINHFPPGPSGSSSFSFVFIGISQFDSCTGTQLLAADCPASLTDQDFQVIGVKLDSATLNATVGCFDSVSNLPFDVLVDLDWTAIGDRMLQSSHIHIRTPGFMVHDNSTGTFRSAEASGSVSDGMINFTPDPSLDANIASVKEGIVVFD